MCHVLNIGKKSQQIYRVPFREVRGLGAPLLALLLQRVTRCETCFTLFNTFGKSSFGDVEKKTFRARVKKNEVKGEAFRGYLGTLTFGSALLVNL